MKKTPKLRLSRETLGNLALTAVRGGGNLIYTISPEICIDTELKPERVQ